MLELNPNILEKNGKPEFVVIPFEEYENLKAYLEDLEDLADLEKAIKEEANEPGLDLDQAKRELGLK